MPDAKPLRFSASSLTVGDLEDLEEITGQSFGDLFSLLGQLEAGGMHKLPIKLITALVFVIRRHENPDFTLADARKVRINELELVLGDEPDPTEAAS
jgi:hypothetical protein